MAKRILLLISLIGIMAHCCHVRAFTVDVNYDNIIYRIDDLNKDEACVLKPMGTGIRKAVIADAVEYMGNKYTVTSIADNAFKECYKLTSVTIPETVESIGNNAFYYCEELTSVTIPHAVTAIGKGTFYRCLKLTSVTMPESVASIGEDAFRDCHKLVSVALPESLTYIGQNAFDGCDSLASLDLPDGLTFIGEYAFSGCNITSLAIPSGITVIHRSAFSGCSRLASLDLPDGVTVIGKSAFYGCKGLNSLVLPAGLTVIGESAFYGCKGLKSVTIPPAVTSIGVGCFQDCDGLTSVTIPPSVTEIRSKCFDRCSKLRIVNISDLAAWCRIAFDRDQASPLCNNGYLFLNGEEVVDLEIPAGITSLGRVTFANCISLETVRIPEGFESFDGYCTFQYCRNLREVYLPSTFKSADVSGVFGDCPDLETVYCSAMTPPSIWYNTFSYSGKGFMTLHVPEGTKALYAEAEGWKNFNEIIDDLQSAGVEAVATDADGFDMDSPYEIYNLGGVRMAGSVETLPAGAYILRQKGKAIKYIAK